MDNENYSLPGIDDILDLTDTEESSSSSNTAIFDMRKPFVLELHELVKDEATPQKAAPAATVKRLKKKKKDPTPHIKIHQSDSSATMSETSSVVPSVEELSKEEYFDAHESYHTMPELQTTAPVTATSLMQTHSDNTNNPKAVQTTIAQRPPAAREEPTATDKPVTRPQ